MCALKSQLKLQRRPAQIATLLAPVASLGSINFDRPTTPDMVLVDDKRLSASLHLYQAEDGIRDLTVTGVQTCALPIFQAAGTEGFELFVLWTGCITDRVIELTKAHIPRQQSFRGEAGLHVKVLADALHHLNM